MNPFVSRVVVSTILATSVSANASFSNVKISQLEQAGLELSFVVSWNTTYDSERSIDILLQTRQQDPVSFVEIVLEKDIENTGSRWVRAGDTWATVRSSWDGNRSGEAIVCVYNADDHLDNACSEALEILPADEARGGISNVNVPFVFQNGSTLSFSVTWTDAGGADGLEDTAPHVDIWMVAQQSDPPAWVELPAEMNVDNENERRSHQDVGMTWELMGWDLESDGELQSCVYDTQDYDNFACSSFVAFSANGNAADDDGGVGNRNTSSGGRGTDGGTVLALVLAGGVVVGLVAWLAVTSTRRRQRRKWLGTANEAEDLPEDAFIRPSDPYAGFG